MSALPSADRTPLVSPDRVRSVVQAALRAASTRFTDAQLEELSGISARCIKSYRVEGREPSLSHALSILCVLGRSGINPVLATIGYVCRPLDDADELQVSAVVAEGLRQFTVIADAATDGRIDHTEAPGCRDAADKLIATVLPLSSAGQAS